MYVHLIDIYVSAKIDEYQSLHFQDMRKKNSITDGYTDKKNNKKKKKKTAYRNFQSGVANIGAL